MPAAIPSLPSPDSGQVPPTRTHGGVPLRNGGMAYARQPSVPHGPGVASRSRNKGHARIRPTGEGPFQALLRRYIRNPMPAPHGLKGGPLLSGLSRPPRTRQQALHRITFCRRSEIRHTDRSAIRHFISSIAKQQMPYHQDKTFFIS